MALLELGDTVGWMSRRTEMSALRGSVLVFFGGAAGGSPEDSRRETLKRVV
jgi:hypothetical protein